MNKKTYTDETGRAFDKYFDAAGNLLREVKTVAGDNRGNIQNTDDPYDPDTTFSGQDVPSQQVLLITDYKYDDLYRVTEVKTPAGKLIKYQYDGLGRQSQRETPDAGITRYWYDKNNNLTYSQDEVQRSGLTAKYTLRTYDGLNRLLTLSEETPNDPNEEEDNPTSGNVFTVNCYDSLAYATVGGIFTNVPSDYYSAINNTKGAIVATAYRTLLTDGWSYKYYRYDARGRVTRFWHYAQHPADINGLGWKSENYYYNSQNQVIRNWYQPNQSDGKVFTYSYDDAARLITTNLYLGSHPENPEEESDAPSSFLALSRYTYNENSQVSTHGLNIDQYVSAYSYNDRNWVSVLTKQGGNPVFAYGLAYNPNGNIRRQSVGGTYLQNLSDQSPLQITYIYDQSNRLLKADKDSSSVSTSFDLINNYDKDGNFANMKRYGSANNLVDNFSYTYFSGTNKLQKVTGQMIDDYSYDANGNQTLDEVNRNKNMKYDNRNLMTEFRGIRQESGLMGLEDKTYMTLYKYDEAGNRTRKVSYQYTGSAPDPEFDLSGDTPPWQLVLDEFYVRDISGKEIAIYSGTSLTQWNIWGLDNVGKINADTTKYYYLKDHLGTIRVVLNSTNQVVSANDYDAWGYQMQNRSYQSTNTMYKFTGKERDNESSYDYFGARYYDSRIGRWGQVEPLLDKYLAFTPYCYSICNPIIAKDINGKDAFVTINKDAKTITFDVTIYYILQSDKPDYKMSITDEQREYAVEMVQLAEDLWNEVGKVNFNGEEYKAVFSFDLQNADQFSERESYMTSERGFNYLEFGTAGNPSVIGGNKLHLVKITEDMIVGKYWYAHELGHILGLKHNYINDFDLEHDVDIMGYYPQHNKPEGSNFIKIFSQLSKQNDFQLLYGVEGVKP